MRYRILHLISSLNHGGAEHQLLLNLGKLSPDLFENYVCCIREEGALADQVKALGVPILSLGVRGKPEWPVAVLQLRKIIRSLGIDLVHTNLTDGDIIGGLAARWAGVPAVSTLVNIALNKDWLVDHPRLNWFKLMPMKQLASLVYHTCHSHFVAISECVKASAITDLKLNSDKISVIYRALAPEWMIPDQPEVVDSLKIRLGAERANPLLLNIGRLTPQKGQKYLLEAMPRVLEALPDARLLIVGQGFLEGELLQLRDRLGLQDSVEFLGSRSDVKQLLQVSDIFVFPSLFEGLGVSLLEAVGMGKPCVASDVGPLPEVVADGESGLLAPPRSPGALAEAIIHLANDHALQNSMSRRSAQIVTKKFNIDGNIKQLQAVYEQVLHAPESANPVERDDSASVARLRH